VERGSGPEVAEAAVEAEAAGVEAAGEAEAAVAAVAAEAAESAVVVAGHHSACS
jgi:hypothetical protein